MRRCFSVLFLALLLFSSGLLSSDSFSQSRECSGAVGQWDFKVFGRDCKGYEEEGRFVMTIDAGCNLTIDILAGIPYAEQYLVTNKSLMVLKDSFYATIDFTVDQCSMLVLKGKLIGGKKIEGTYRYEDGGGGSFEAVRKSYKPEKPDGPDELNKPFQRRK